jgi:hypothetical protein
MSRKQLIKHQLSERVRGLGGSLVEAGLAQLLRDLRDRIFGDTVQAESAAWVLRAGRGERQGSPERCLASSR